MNDRNSPQNNTDINVYYTYKKLLLNDFYDYYKYHNNSLLIYYDIPYSKYMTKEICEINGQKLFKYINEITETETKIIKEKINQNDLTQKIP